MDNILIMSQTMRKKSNSNSSVVHDDEWHEKYAFILALLRRPYTLLVKDTLAKERDKLMDKLATYRMERALALENLKPHFNQ